MSVKKTHQDRVLTPSSVRRVRLLIAASESGSLHYAARRDGASLGEYAQSLLAIENTLCDAHQRCSCLDGVLCLWLWQ